MASCRSVWVQSALRVLAAAPNQREDALPTWIRFDEQVAEGARDLRPGVQIVVLTWLRLSPRNELSAHPQDDMSQPPTGVSSTCSPNRPNPIGLHRAALWRAAGSGLKSTPWRQSTGRRSWTSNRPSTRPHDARHAAVLSGDLPARNRRFRAEFPAQLIEQRRHGLGIGVLVERLVRDPVSLGAVS